MRRTWPDERESSRPGVVQVGMSDHGERLIPVDATRVMSQRPQRTRRVRRDGVTLSDADQFLARQWSDRNDFGPHEIKKSSEEEVWWVCALCSHEFEKSVVRRMRSKGRSRGCPRCAPADRTTLAIKERALSAADPELAKQWGPLNELGPDDVGFRSGKAVHWICPRGHEFWASPAKRADTLSAARGCRECFDEMVAEGNQRGRAKFIRHKGARWLADEFPELAKQWGPLNECAPTEVAVASFTEYHWICPRGHEFWEKAVVRTYSTTPSQGCRECYENDIHEFHVVPGRDFAAMCPEAARRWSPRNDKPPSAYAPMSRKMVYFICPSGHEYRSRVEAATVGRGCPVCSKRERRHNYRRPFSEANPELVAEWSPANRETPDKVAYGSQELVWWVCSARPSHPTWQSTPSNRSLGHGRCPTCHPGYRSYAESDLFDELQRLGAPEGIRSERSILSPLELDMYFPEAGLAVEFNGLHWHSEDRKGREYHREKSVLCQQANVRLVQVWEDEWIERRTVVLRGILAKLGCLDAAAQSDREFAPYARRIGARECEIAELTSGEAAEFLEQNHIQGKKGGSIRLGLRRGPQLVAVLVASVSGTKATIERYATACIVRGGFGRLESALMRRLPGQVRSLVTFADLCVSDGSLYENGGWERDGEIAPDYKYVIGKRRVHKFNYRLARFRSDPSLEFREHMTEQEMASLNGISRIWDAGKIRYTKEVLS